MQPLQTLSNLIATCDTYPHSLVREDEWVWEKIWSTSHWSIFQNLSLDSFGLQRRCGDDGMEERLSTRLMKNASGYIRHECVCVAKPHLVNWYIRFMFWTVNRCKWNKQSNLWRVCVWKPCTRKLLSINSFVTTKICWKIAKIKI